MISDVYRDVLHVVRGAARLQLRLQEEERGQRTHQEGSSQFEGQLSNYQQQ